MRSIVEIVRGSWLLLTWLPLLPLLPLYLPVVAVLGLAYRLPLLVAWVVLGCSSWPTRCEWRRRER